MATLPFGLDKYEIQARRLSTNGIELNVFEAGSGPLVVLLHGFPECWASWGPQISFLLDNGYRVVAPEMRGYGQSDAPEGVEAYDTVMEPSVVARDALRGLRKNKLIICSPWSHVGPGWLLHRLAPAWFNRKIVLPKWRGNGVSLAPYGCRHSRRSYHLRAGSLRQCGGTGGGLGANQAATTADTVLTSCGVQPYSYLTHGLS